MSGARVVWSTCADSADAERIARALVEEGLAPCINLLPAVRSIYRWRGGIEQGDEVMLMIKCRGDDYPRLEARLRELHPYEVPEVLCLAVEAGLPEYLAWLERPDE